MCEAPPMCEVLSTIYYLLSTNWRSEYLLTGGQGFFGL